MSPWRELDHARLWHRYTHHGSSPAPVPIVRAEGAYLYDANGREILDAISSWWVTLHGHAHPVIAEAIAEQARTLEQVIFAGFTHEPAARLAAELVSVLPEGLERVFFSDNGSTAVEVALKIALQFWSNQGQTRPLIAALENAYHGDTLGAMSVSARGVFTEPFGTHLWEIARLPDPTTGDTVSALDRLLEERGGELAALIVEPLLMGAGGMRMYFVCSANGPTSTGSSWSPTRCSWASGASALSSRASVRPDIVCLSKGITGGFLPLGATVASADVWEAFRGGDRRRTLFHGHSYTANPLACAAARASFRLLDEESARRRAAIEAAHRAGLGRLRSHPRVMNPRVLGTVAALDLVAEPGYLSPIGQALGSFALEHGVLLRPLGNVVYLLPPFCTTPEQVTRVYQIIERFLEDR